MAFVKIMVHAVWGTKNRYPYLKNEIRSIVVNHILLNAKNKGIFIDRLNGHTEHLHCLLSLDPQMSISKVMQLIKGESAYWINKQKLIMPKFEWADEYYAASVNANSLDAIRNYIDRQEEHHKQKTFQQEYDEFFNHLIS